MQRLLMSKERLVLGERSRISMCNLLLCLLNQEGLMINEKHLLLLCCHRRTALARPHVNGAGTEVLWEG